MSRSSRGLRERPAFATCAEKCAASHMCRAFEPDRPRQLCSSKIAISTLPLASMTIFLAVFAVLLSTSKGQGLLRPHAVETLSFGLDPACEGDGRRISYEVLETCLPATSEPHEYIWVSLLNGSAFARTMHNGPACMKGQSTEVRALDSCSRLESQSNTFGSHVLRWKAAPWNTCLGETPPCARAFRTCCSATSCACDLAPRAQGVPGNFTPACKACGLLYQACCMFQEVARARIHARATSCLALTL